MPYVRLLNGVHGGYFPNERCAIVRPGRIPPSNNYPAALCEIVLYVTDESPPRVFVGDGDPASNVAREADDVEVAALAERFGSDELRAALRLRL